MTSVLHIDGAPATVEDLTHVALVNYGAYTAFRVEPGGVRGLDLHLARLEASAVELFGEAVGEARLRELMRGAVGQRPSCWLRVSLFAPEIGMRDPSWRGRPRVMVGAFPPPPPLADALRVRVQTYEREAAHLKHAATFGLMRSRRAARDAGFDDVLFVDGDDRISEGSLWNIGFRRGDEVVWPRAPMLAGVAQALIRRGLATVGLTDRTRDVGLSDLDGFDTAFACNSATPACPITAIDGREFLADPELIARLQAAWAANTPELI